MIHIDSDNKLLQSNIINKITIFELWISGIINVIILFLLFSFQKKETIKKITSIIARDYLIISFLSILLFIVSLNNLFVIK
jgi:hypothetical protein